MNRMFLIYSWRTRWRALVVITLMIGLTGAVVLAALAGARRSSSALNRFHDAGRTLDVFLSGDITTPEPPGLLEVLDGPLVESTNDLVFLFVDVDEVGVVFAPTSRRGLEIERGVLLDGRRANPDEPDEVTLSVTAAKNLGLEVGDRLEAGSISQEQADALLTSGTDPTSLDGPPLRLRVVGITRTGFDLAAGDATALTLTTPAFYEDHREEIGVGSRSHMVRLVDAPGALDRFTDAVEQAYGGEHLPSINVGQGEDTVAASIAVITAAFVVVALVIGVAGVLWIASVMARHLRLFAGEIGVLRALGSTRGERRALLLGGVAPALLGGLALAPMLAVALSPLFPVGVARRVDPDPGVHVDALVLLVGSAALAVVLGLAVLFSAARLARHGRPDGITLPRAPLVLRRTTRLLRPPAATGVRFALHAPGRTSVPVLPALGGALVAVVGLVAVAVVGTSLQRLVDSPSRWGTTWDVAVAPGELALDGGASEDPFVSEPDQERLRSGPDIEAAGLLLYDEQITINGVEAISMTLEPVKGAITPTVIEGREPRAGDEIAVARDTLRDIGAELGATVTVRSRSQRSATFRLVGVIAFPTIGEPSPVATGASLTAQGGHRLALGTGGDDVGTPYVVLRWAAGVDHEEALARLGIEGGKPGFEPTVAAPAAPPEVTGLEDVQQFPVLAAAALALLGVIATSHALVVTVRRRRLELGVLSSLGFTPAQRHSVILGQATTIAVTALVVGLPLGAVVGRVLWSAIADSMGLASDVAFPLVLLAIGAAGFVAVLDLIAALPARAARRLRVAGALRSE